MEKNTEYQARTQGSLPKFVMQKQVNAKSGSRRQVQQNTHDDNYQIALQKDIAKLQKQLKQEVDTHRTLERALTRTPGALPRFSPGLATEVQKLVAEVAVLEEEVVHLEESITILHEGILVHNEAMHITHSLQGHKVSGQMSHIVAEGQPSTSSTIHAHGCAAREKRISVVAKLLPSTIKDTHAKPLLLRGSPTFGEPRSKLYRSSSFRRETSGKKTSPHEIPYVEDILI